MKVFVTGGSSPLGELVLPRLVSVHDVYALARSPEAARVVERRGAVPVRGVLEESESGQATWKSIVNSADAVVHLAGMRLADQLVAHLDAEQPLTVVSSASLHNPSHPLSAELRAAEERLASTMSGTLKILRPTMIYGSSRDRNIRLLARAISRLPVTPKFIGGGFVQPVLADDVADAIFETLGRPGHLVADLGARDPVRLGDIVAVLANLLGRPMLPFSVPVAPLAWVAGTIGHWKHSSAIHALAMLRHDRSIVAAGESILGHPATPVSVGLAIAVPRYRLSQFHE